MSDHNVNMNTHFYTYAFLREDGTPYYIGKGKGNRAWKKRKTPPFRPKENDRIILLKTGLTEEEAFRHEVYMIFILGKKGEGTGILLNIADGGQGPSGFVHGEKYRDKNREGQSGMIFWSNTKTGATTYSRDCPGVGWVKGHTDKMKEEKSERQRGMRLWHNPETGVQTWSREEPGEGWVIGMAPDTRRKCGNGGRGRKPHNSGLKAWHKPETKEIRYSRECPGEEWKPGMGPRCPK